MTIDGGKILDTTITWEMIEEDFSKSYKCTAKTGSNRRVEVFGKGNGFASKIALAHFDWHGEKAGLPEVAVLKITTCQGITELLETMMALPAEIIERNASLIHNNELNFYQNARSKWGFPEEIRLPEYYTGRPYCKELKAGYIAMEYFENCVKMDMHAENKEDVCTEVTKWLATITAWAIRNPKIMAEIRDSVELKPSDTLKELFTYDKTLANLNSFVDAHPQRVQEAEAMRKIVDLVPDFNNYQRLLANTCQPPLLAHMDMWSGNILWRKTTDREYQPIAIIDWQVCEVGTPINDLVRWIPSAVSVEELLTNRNKYLRDYYSVLLEKADGCKLPWETFEKLVDSFERLYPLLMVPMALLFIKPEMMGMMLAARADHEKAEAQQNYMKKMFGFIECAVECIQKYY